jgi:hypothetical protein
MMTLDLLFAAAQAAAMFSRLRFGFAALVLLSAAAACLVSPVLGGATDGGSSGAPSATCGLTLTGPAWNASCQAWSAQYCCNELKACAADPACAKLVACAEACPTPRQDACLNACEVDAGVANPRLNAFGACTKATPTSGQGIPSNCQWPNGG